MQIKIRKALIITALFCSYQFTAQVSIQGDYLGTLSFGDSGLLTYSVEFTCVNSECTGYSISDVGGANETKSELDGQINFSENKVYFYERNIVYTKASNETYNEICLLEFDFDLDELISERNQGLRGSFKGFFSDRVLCLEGIIQLKSKAFLAQKAKLLKERLNSKLARNALGDSSVQILTRRLDSISSRNKESLGSTSNKTINFDKNNVLILKDIGNNDGDIIRLIQLDQRRDINLTKKPFYLENRPSTEIIIIGIDEGKFPTIPIEFTVKRFNEIQLREVLILHQNDTIIYHLKN